MSESDTYLDSVELFLNMGVVFNTMIQVLSLCRLDNLRLISSFKNKL